MSDHPRLRWQAPPVPAETAEALVRGHKLPALVADVLAARGWEPGGELAAFLGERPSATPDPLTLVGVYAAATRLWQAIDAGELITICGDYDVDGVTGTALLVGVLRAAGARVDWYLPHRFHDGYGLNKRALDRVKAAGAHVIVTVDNGITSHAELAYARELGIDAIVTDHHLPGAELPVAQAIVNPRLMDDPGPFAPLAGVGVAYVLMGGLAALRPACTELAAALQAQRDLVAIGTIGDLAPLAGLNRDIVRSGLNQLATAPRTGLAALARSVKISLGGAGAADAIAHRLIPRLNAAGRMAHPDLALALLLETDAPRARERADQLGNLNRQRRILTEATEARCHELLRARLQHGELAEAVIVLADAGWHHGVTGIVAARLAERYGRPAILFAPDGDGWRGSGRSVPGFDLHAVLEELEQHLGRFGGHAAAVGLTVSAEGYPDFSRALEAVVARRRGEAPPTSRNWRVDLEVPLAALTPRDVEALGCLEPTGMENPVPVMAARGLRVVRQGQRGPEGQHLWLELAQDDPEGRAVEAIGFGMGALYPLGERVDAVFTPVMERWQGRQRLQLRLVAVGAQDHGG